MLRSGPPPKRPPNPRSSLLLIPVLASLCTSSALGATGSIVLESNQNPLDGSLRNGGSPIGNGDIKVLPFTSGTSGLELTSV